MLPEIKNVVDLRFEWAKPTFISVENMFAYHLIGRSRYSRYLKIVYLFLYKHLGETDSNKFTKLSELLIVVNKLFFVYSILYAKSLYRMHSFMYSIQKSIINNEIDYVINQLNEKLLAERNNNLQSIKNNLKGYITDNARKKNLMCWLAAYLDEVAVSDDIKIINEKLFKTPFDIEHIHATADGSFIVDNTLQNSIGNLVMLEQAINRRIKDAPFLKSGNHSKHKIEEYKNSKYISVRKISEMDNWGVQEIELRREKEVQKIVQYLFQS